MTKQQAILAYEKAREKYDEVEKYYLEATRHYHSFLEQHPGEETYGKKIVSKHFWDDYDFYYIPNKTSMEYERLREIANEAKRAFYWEGQNLELAYKTALLYASIGDK